ncbi:MAG: hypothetical protein ABH800_02130 [Candidatus Nealsonbacteria bacterium]
MDNNSFGVDKKGVLKAIIFAIVIAFLGIGILGWQYRKLEKERLPLIEEEMEKQKEEIELRSAQDFLDNFMSARKEKQEEKINAYLTEGAMEKKFQGIISFAEDFDSYDILKKEKMEDGRYRFTLKIYQQEGIVSSVEIIFLVKILDAYYVDSVDLAG